MRTISPALLEKEEQWDELHLVYTGDRLRVIIELNLMHAKGLDGALEDLTRLFEREIGDPGQLIGVTKSYMRADLTQPEIELLASKNEDVTKQTRGGAAVQDGGITDRPIYHIWPDFKVGALIDRSVATIKADAAQRSFSASGRDIVWAVLDTGIDQSHPHFKKHATLKGGVELLHRDFTLDPEDYPGKKVPDDVSIAKALTDYAGHGTHVAGIIAGALDEQYYPGLVVHKRVQEGDKLDFASQMELTEVRQIEKEDKERFAGVAPHCKLISLKVLKDDCTGEASAIMRALAHIRENLNNDPKLLRVQGVNLSVGYPFNAKWFACGQSPICVEVDRLVKSGVVVVVAAGNSGHGSITTDSGKLSTGLSLSINDPGNAQLAITVGATHRDMPHTYGVSYFSSKGPTGDGRLKPDLVAPGETITSCAAGQIFANMGLDEKSITKLTAAYADYSGTSMAAPHVSGAIAAFLSIRREFIGRPEEVKRIFMDSATSLGRETYFQGRGLIDLMRAIQSV